eukprot:353445-Chlamydomonas_euryale.AAC.6
MRVAMPRARIQSSRVVCTRGLRGRGTKPALGGRAGGGAGAEGACNSEPACRSSGSGRAAKVTRLNEGQLPRLPFWAGECASRVLTEALKAPTRPRSLQPGHCSASHQIAAAATAVAVAAVATVYRCIRRTADAAAAAAAAAAAGFAPLHRRELRASRGALYPRAQRRAPSSASLRPAAPGAHDRPGAERKQWLRRCSRQRGARAFALNVVKARPWRLGHRNQSSLPPRATQAPRLRISARCTLSRPRKLHEGLRACSVGGNALRPFATFFRGSFDSYTPILRSPLLCMCAQATFKEQSNALLRKSTVYQKREICRWRGLRWHHGCRDRRQGPGRGLGDHGTQPMLGG